MDLDFILNILKQKKPVEQDVKKAIQQIVDEISARKKEPLQITYTMVRIERVKEFLKSAETRMVKIPASGLSDSKIIEKALIGTIQSVQSEASNALDILTNEYSKNF